MPLPGTRLTDGQESPADRIRPPPAGISLNVNTLKETPMRTSVLAKALGLLLLAAAPFAEAAESTGNQTATGHPLPEVVVVATPLTAGNVVDRYGGTTTVVGAEQVRDLNAQDVTNALRTTPGVTISRYNPIGAFAGAEGGGVFIRGMGMGRPGGEIKTTIDGVQVGNPVYNHPLMDMLPVDPAGSIEVIKGVQPSQMVSGFGGVNIVPKQMRDDGFLTKASAAYGSFGTVVETMEHGGKKEAFDYYLGQAYRYSDGDRNKADGQLTDQYMRMGYQAYENWNVSAFGMHTDNYARDPGPTWAPNPRNERYETRTWTGILTLANKYEAAEGDVKFYWNNADGTWLNQAGNDPDLHSKGDYYGAKIKEALHLWQGGEILAGFDADQVRGSVDTTLTRFGWHTYTTLSPHLAVSHMIGEKEGWHVIPSIGARYLNNDLFGEDWSPHAGVVAGYKDTEMHASTAKGVNYPGLDVLAMGAGGQTLKPETLYHNEVGLRHTFFEGLKGDVTWFYDHGSNRYVRPSGAATAVWTNYGFYELQGTEATVNWEPLKNLALYAGTTWLYHRPMDLPYAPEWTWSFGGNWLFLDRFKLSADAQYIDSMHVNSWGRLYSPSNPNTVGGYFLLNAKLAWMLPADLVKGMEGELFVAGENLTDTQYAYRPGYPMPGIGCMGGLSVSF
jgi:iron complex outermembrane receptor protein